jgi:glutamine synthetase
MLGMRLDHVSYAAGPDGLAGTAARLGALLGEEFTQVYTAIKRFELKRFRDHVSDWERSEYLELY